MVSEIKILIAFKLIFNLLRTYQQNLKLSWIPDINRPKASSTPLTAPFKTISRLRKIPISTEREKKKEENLKLLEHVIYTAATSNLIQPQNKSPINIKIWNVNRRSYTADRLKTFPLFYFRVHFHSTANISQESVPFIELMMMLQWRAIVDDDRSRDLALY